MNVDKMRHQLARTSAAAERYEEERWLASLTPEHRAKHTGPRTGFCGECLSVSIAAMNETNRRRSIEMRAAVARMAERGRVAREREAATR